MRTCLSFHLLQGRVFVQSLISPLVFLLKVLAVEVAKGTGHSSTEERSQDKCVQVVTEGTTFVLQVSQ